MGQEIVTVLSENILPIFIVAGIGFWLQRRQAVDIRVLSYVAFNGFSPCLVFASLVNSDVPAGELGRLALFGLLTMLLLGGLGWLSGRVLGLPRLEQLALILAVMFVNSGNFGLPLVQLRHGEAGVSRAIIFYLMSTILVYTLGVFIAASGKLDWRAAAGRLLRIPAVYAVSLAFVVYGFQIELPSGLLSGIRLAGSGAIPLMQVILGMQLAQLSGRIEWRVAIPALFLRLVIGTGLAVGLASWLGLQGVGRAASIIQASMPSAVIIILLATEFEVKPALVTSIVVLSTLLSPLTLALAIIWFGL